MKQQRWEESEKRKSQKKENQNPRKGRKVAKHCIFPMFCGSGRSKSRLPKAVGAEPSGEIRGEKVHDAVVARSTFGSQNVQSIIFRALLEVEMWEKCAPLWCKACFQVKMLKTPQVRSAFGRWEMFKKCTRWWCEAHFQVKMCKAHHARSTFGRWDVQKAHAVVARRCPKHIWKSKRTRHTVFAKLLEVEVWKKCKWKVLGTGGLGPLLDVQMSKKCTLLWCEAVSQVKSVKNSRSRTTFGCSDLEKVHPIVARSTLKAEGLGPLLDVQMSKKWALTLTLALALILRMQLQRQRQQQDTATTTTNTLQLQLRLHYNYSYSYNYTNLRYTC